MTIINKKVFSAIGTMSGTSFDGIDISFLKTDGKKIYYIGRSSYMPYSPQIQKNIATLIYSPHCTDLDLLLETSNQITFAHAAIIKKNLKKNNLNPSDVDLIGFHGQTIYHNHQKKLTLQIGNPHLLSKLTQIQIISDIRNKDIAEGGEGAPLAPIYHKILYSNIKKPVAVLNIGGVANITYLDIHNKILAFDTGPGCALINDLISKETGKPYDKNGDLASQGKIHEKIVDDIIKNNPFFSKKPPKALDRNEFTAISKYLSHLSLKDALATLTFFSAKSIFESTKFLPKNPLTWFACGGGRNNKFLINLLSKRFGLNIKLIDEIQIDKGIYADGDFIESQAFAVLGVRAFLGIPLCPSK